MNEVDMISLMAAILTSGNATSYAALTPQESVEMALRIRAEAVARTREQWKAQCNG